MSNRIPLGRTVAKWTGAWLGGAVMSALIAWGVIDHNRRAQPALLGRRPVPAPEWAAADHWDICRLAGRCDTPWHDIRWYAVDSTALPADLCRVRYEAVGCFDGDTRALTLTAAGYADTVLVRHELMHAATWTLWAGRHPCRFFRDDWRTLTATGCEP